MSEKQAKSETQRSHVEVSLPRKLKISLVPLNELRSYESLFGHGSLFSSIAVGFWTGYVTTSPSSAVLFWTAIAFTVASLACFGLAAYFRWLINAEQVVKSIHWN